MMLKAATRMIIERMTNITTRSTCSAEKKVSLRCCQSVRISGRSVADWSWSRIAVDVVGIVDEDLDRGRLRDALVGGVDLLVGRHHVGRRDARLAAGPRTS